jgi:hypothetical protein
VFQTIRTIAGKSTVSKMLQKHFGGQPLESLFTTGRTFPLASRVDVQVALDDYFRAIDGTRRLGLHSRHSHGMEAMGIAQLLQRTPFPIDIGPRQYDDVDVGESTRDFRRVALSSDT